VSDWHKTLEGPERESREWPRGRRSRSQERRSGQERRGRTRKGGANEGGGVRRGGARRGEGGVRGEGGRTWGRTQERKGKGQELSGGALV
jgi:hypothetical protein